ncbi:hypothetical protein [Nisaea sp.]|uniref:hypothetical protein n=1 Tax=Nisaea sp. TaxID=2024842 RepID=UPI003B52216E
MSPLKVGATESGPVGLTIDTTEMDSLHRLPLGLLPLKTQALKRHSLIKNAQLNSVVELFRDGESGSGQIRPDSLPGHFNSSDPELLSDIAMLKRLAAVGSYDVYTLRVALRELDIGFEHYDALKLSPEKYRELTQFMKHYTRPIIRRLFAKDGTQLESYGNLVEYLRNPDRDTVLKELERLAADLDTSVSSIPRFLENYGDTFLGFSYFRSCLTESEKRIRLFRPWTEEFLRSPIARDNASLQTRVVHGLQSLQEIVESVRQRFTYFDQSSTEFWENPTAESFRCLRSQITEQHASTGSVLCGLVVKFNLWTERFSNHGGGHQRRLEFLESEILPGLTALAETERRIANRFQN